MPAVFIVGASYAECDRYTTIAMFALSMGCMGAYYSGIKMNVIDLSPNYAAELFGLANAIGSIPGFLAPYILGVLTPNV